MDTVSIRDLRGTVLRESARTGKLLAITNHRALIGVAIPVAPAWADHLIDYNWSRVQQSITEGERAVAAGEPMRTLDDVPSTPGTSALPLQAAVVDGTLMQTPESKGILRKLHEGFHPPRSAAEQEHRPDEPSVHTVRVGDLSGHLIEQAGESGQTLAVTDDRQLVAIVLPVTKGLVQFLIDKTMSRVLDSIYQAEKQLRTPGELSTLDRVAFTEIAHLPQP